MSPTGVNPDDDLARFAERHLVVVLAVMARVTSDPTLVFDIATEALAAGQRAARDEVPGPEDETSQVRCVLEAAERVFRASVFDGRVPQKERLRARSVSPTVLSDHDLSAIGALGRESLAEHREAEVLVETLQRSAPSLNELRTISLSPLVRTEGQSEHEREAREPER